MAAKTTIEQIDTKALAGLIRRVEEAIEHGLALSAEDLTLLLNAIHTLATLQEQLEDKDVTLHKLRKLLGMIAASEKRKDKNKDKAGDQNGAGDDNENQDPASKKPKKPPQRKPKQAPAKTVEHKHQTLKKGDPCPEPQCDKGKLYRTRPRILLRITAHAPYEATKHIVECFRCNLCGQIFPAQLPEEVLQDGDAQQEYGYSARSLMAIHKFFSGQGYHHQGNLSDLVGHKVSASSNFDQCEYLANDVMPVYRQLKKEAAQAVHFQGDDTTHRILNQKPEERPNRNGKGVRLRTGIYSSCLIAKTEAQEEIVLFETSLGHLGEFLDAILKNRPPGLSPPTMMSDALSSNHSTVTSMIRSLCNAHARRQFVDIEDQYPEIVASVLKRYGVIWTHEHEVQAAGMDDNQRLKHHQKHSLPVMAELKAWCEAQLEAEDFEENSALGKAIRYFLNHYPGLTEFCRAPGAQIDNNRTEETLKMVIRGRKNYMFFKTENGAGIANVLTSLIATAWRAGINVYEYLTHLQRYKVLVKKDPSQWTPYRYEETLARLNELETAA